MSTNCEYCGKLFENEPKFPLEGGGEICEACYISWQNENEAENFNPAIDEKILDILEHKEDYRYEKLEETIEWLDSYGFSNEANELKRYMRKAKKREYEEKENTIYDDNDIVYQGSGTTIWTSIIEFVCILYMAVMVVLGIVVGGILGGGGGGVGSFIGLLLGGSIGLLVGAFGEAILMTFVTLCKNISVMTDNSAQILMKLDKINGKNGMDKNVCSNCGRKMAYDAKFCGFCGEKSRKNIKY